MGTEYEVTPLVTVSRSGDVVITGDAEVNVIVAEISGGALTLSGGEAGIMFRVGRQAPVGALEIPLPTSVRSLSVNADSGSG